MNGWLDAVSFVGVLALTGYFAYRHYDNKKKNNR